MSATAVSRHSCDGVPDWARLHELPTIGHAGLLEVADRAVEIVTAFFEEVLDSSR